MGRIILVLIACAAFARADILVFKDGRYLEHASIDKSGELYLIHYKAGDVKIPAALVRDYYKQGSTGEFVPQTDKEKKKADQGFVPWKGRWVKKGLRDKYFAKEEAARRKRVEQMQERRLWRNHATVKTRQFIFKHTLPDDVFQEYRDLFEAYYAFFTKYWKIKPSPKYGKATINIYHSREYFEQVGGIGGGVVGWYMPLNRDLNFYVDRDNRSFTIDVMFHEGNHMLTHMINEKFRYPWWIGEGMAEYFGASEWDPEAKKMSVGHLQSGRLAVLHDQFENPEKRLPLHSLLTQGSNLGAIGYSWAWSFCHFLLSTKKYGKKFKKMYVALGRGSGIRRVAIGMGYTTVQGEENVEVLKKYLRVKNLDALQQEWYAYITGALKMEKGQDLDWGNAGYIMSLYGERKKARKYFKRAIDAGSKDAFVLYGYAELKFAQNMPGIALKYATKALEQDPLHARARCLVGQALVAKGDKEQGHAAMKLAAELEPDNREIWFALTFFEEAEKELKEKGE